LLTAKGDLMSKKWSCFWIGFGLWFFIGGKIGLLSLWTASSNYIPDIILKVIGVTFFTAMTFGAVTFIYVGIKEWKRKETEAKKPRWFFVQP